MWIFIISCNDNAGIYVKSETKIVVNNNSLPQNLPFAASTSESPNFAWQAFLSINIPAKNGTRSAAFDRAVRKMFINFKK